MLTITILIAAVIFHIFGQMVGAVTKGDFGDTVSASVHAIMPYVSIYFIWQIIFSFLGGSVATLAGLLSIIGVLLIIGIWELVVFVFSFSAIHKTTKGKAFLTWLVPFVIAVIVFVALFVVFYNIYLGLAPLLGAGGVGGPVI